MTYHPPVYDVFDAIITMAEGNINHLDERDRSNARERINSMSIVQLSIFWKLSISQVQKLKDDLEKEVGQ